MNLHLVTDRSLTLGRPLLDIIRAAVAGGTSLVQLREKDCSTREFVELGQAVASLLQGYKIPLIINDRVDVALAIGAQGVHIGQSDMPYPQARAILGSQAIIGLSVETPEQALAANLFDVDYLGLSPVFATTTKMDLPPQLGLQGVQEIRAVSRHQLIAIGGINSDNAENVITAGAHGLAVVSAICAASDPKNAAMELCKKIAVAKAKAVAA
ncbi:thiamine-phosphate pyrophosphorylase [Desulfuromusa kysingii]|uniref:Thiamine-phosphate synthase n=1 Tax=Desulfuromusa kysingii TaxID=37625 RepID=A0A1H4AX14_9BACT|nr:thiamine phosphate synthase [Desulfuromusa kysingii]SEA40421.1 thiamine-phosphate pyrophosphorylase [Desulfuromusa kysingii]